MRSMPAWSETTQTRPLCGVVIRATSGKVSPYSACVGSVTSTKSEASGESPIEAVYWKG